MTTLLILALLAVTGVILLVYWWRKRIDALRYAAGAVLGSGLALAIFWSVTVVAPGTVKVQILFGTVAEETLSEGLHIINPLVDLVAYDVRRQRVDVTAAQGQGSGAPAVGADGVRLDRVDATMPFRLVPEMAGRVHQRMGPNYLFLMVAPVARSALRDAISQFPAESVATTNRDAVAARATELFASKLIAELAESGFSTQEAGGAFVVSPTQLRRVELPARILQANAEKRAAEIDLERQRTITLIAQEEAVRRGNEGQGVRNLIDSLGLARSPSPEQIADLLRAMANKTTADALVRAVEDGDVNVMVIPHGTPTALTGQ